MYIPLAAVLITAAVILFWLSVLFKRKAGLPGGKIVYSDSHLWKKVDRTFFDETIGLAGRPDYIIHNKGKIIPVEVKSKNIKSSPYNSHILQLTAYCRLIETSFKIRPDYGILKYPDRTFKIDYTESLESQLLELVDSIREKDAAGQGHRSHQSAAKCSGCSCSSICEEVLI